MTFTNRFPKHAFALLCLALAPLAGRAAAPAALGRAVDLAVSPLMVQYDIPGMAVAVTVGGQAMFFSYGVASRATGTPVTEHTLFELGSVSKPFTAMLATYAQAEGKLTLGDHPSRHIPQLKGTAIDAASLLDLGTYSAGGLPMQVPDMVTDDKQVLAYLGQWKPESRPGTMRRYSNPSIGLFGRAAALALGSDFREAMEQTLFPAFGLRETYVQVPARKMTDYAWGYDKGNNPVRVSADVFDAEAYGVKSSAADLVRFVQANIEPGRMPQPWRAAIEATQAGYFSVGEMVQGLGWEQYHPPISLDRLLAGNSPTMSGEANPIARFAAPQGAPRGTLFNKTGATRGFGTYVMFVPEHKVGIVLLANKAYPIPARIGAAHAILAQVLAAAQ